MDRCRVCRNCVEETFAKGPVPELDQDAYCLALHDPANPPKRCEDVIVGHPRTAEEAEYNFRCQEAGV